MKAIYITSTEPYSGKSAVCLALGRKLQAKGLKIGYLKPVSTQPWRTSEGQLADEDAAFFCKMLNLDENPTKGGNPISENTPMVKAKETSGIFFPILARELISIDPER